MPRSPRSKALQTAIMSVLGGQGRSLSAYDILNKLRQAAPQLAPTTIYRALKSLCASGQVLRIESLNAYALRQTRDTDAPVIVAICDDCGALRESVAPEVLTSLTRMARQTGIEPTHHVVEIHGQCADCGAAQNTRDCPAPPT